MNKDDLLIKNPSTWKKRNIVIAPLVVTYNPGNQPFKHGTEEHIDTMHKDPKLKFLFPQIVVFTRQNFNKKIRIMRKRFNKGMIGERDENCPRAGNYKLHEKRCMSCERIVDRKQNF